jgi:aminoglycoside 3-N-acetyltransferase
MGLVARLRTLRAHYGLRAGLRRELTLQADKVLRRVTRNRLVRDLRSLGVQPGDTIFVHLAMRQLGYVPGGPEAVIAALKTAIGEAGTLVMPAYPAGGVMFEYAKQHPVLDARRTPADVGVVPEIFRRQSGTLRSLHPTHTVCAWGKHAEFLVEGHERSETPFAPGTPFRKFVDLGGRELVLGEGVHFSILRVIEDARTDYPLPVYWPEPFALDVIDVEGKRHTVVTKVHNPVIARYRDPHLVIPALKARGLVRDGRVGHAHSHLIECAQLVSALSELVDEGVLAFRITPDDYRRTHGAW